ncbi:MAG TPA: HAMP domain-containing sensor histidine kinase [Gemmatimonadaceae bacterium]|nr:HAMP domain-containing sensor histidine kinase [Gemmatimonadaceae bacterium]
MTAILAVVLVAALVATYATLAGSARETARASLRRATHQLATLADSAIVTTRARYLSVSRDTAIRRILAAGRADSTANTALARLRQPTDSGLPIELWSADGRRLAFIGNDRLTATPPRGDDRAIRSPSLRFIGIDSVRAADTVRVGRLYTVGKTAYLWTVIPVREGSREIGYIARQGRIASNRAAEETVRALAGGDVTTYYRNADGTVWTAISGAPLPASRVDSTNAGTFATGAAGRSMDEEERINGTPLVVGMERPESAVLAGPRAVVRRLALLSLLLLLTGSLLAWLVARRVSRPLRELTESTTAVARGDYETRAETADYAEVAQLAGAFNHMTQEIAAGRAELEERTRDAQDANRAKSQFLATVSHELRTPLNAIGGYVELLEMGLRGPITDTQRRDLQRIRAAQAHLLGLISGMLDLTRIEAGNVSYSIEALAVEPFLSGLQDLVGPQTAAKSIELHIQSFDPDLAVRADAEKLRQVMLNLISNAVRHTPTGGAISIEAAALDTSRIAIRVTDTGAGIPADKREQIFEPFVQLDRSLTNTTEGVGLGLAISRDLARGMGGDLLATDREGGGACFTITLPRARPSGAKEFVTGETAAAKVRR